MARRGASDLHESSFGGRAGQRAAFRRNWWGFVGRRSADAALHEKAGPELVEACRAKASYLAAGQILVTDAGPRLSAKYVLHTVVPGHPSSRDPRPMPPERAAEYAADEDEAAQILERCFAGLLATAAELGVESLCCPAIGCGCRGYPADVAAKIALGTLAPEDLSGELPVPYVEVRFWDHGVLAAWMHEASSCRGLVECEESEVMSQLWQGDPLDVWADKKRQAASPSSCSLM
eukprot:TRINITY_DN54496_c0_g1_i1.p1 TRINITY_DN54496_c0_g1~~TRINITY_DN54496_c0_g1_i1.p1  ORF type:complete len:234 (+),score=38.44 TRINITY_DN54496_c0_g1_i1:110-811(+)